MSGIGGTTTAGGGSDASGIHVDDYAYVQAQNGVINLNGTVGNAGEGVYTGGGVRSTGSGASRSMAEPVALIWDISLR